MLYAVIIIFIGIIISEIIYSLYKKYKKNRPNGLILVMTLSPIIASIISVLNYDSNSFTELLRGLIFFTIIVLLIPLNIICLRNSFRRTGKSARNTFEEAKNLIEEQKEKNEEFKNAWEKRKKDDD